jgi:negative regulator of replication initiation
MSDQMIVRIDRELKSKVNSLAKAEGKSISDVVRALLVDYVRNRDIAAYVDDLWGRIGGKFASRGIRPADIRKAVKAARTPK